MIMALQNISRLGGIVLSDCRSFAISLNSTESSSLSIWRENNVSLSPAYTEPEWLAIANASVLFRFLISHCELWDVSEVLHGIGC